MQIVRDTSARVLAFVVGLTMGLGALLAVPAFADDVDPSDGDVTFQGQIVTRDAPGGALTTIGIPGLDVTLYIDDGRLPRPIGHFPTDANGRFSVEVAVGSGQRYTFSVKLAESGTYYFWTTDPLQVANQLSDANWVSPPDGAPYILGVWSGETPSPSPTPTPTPTPVPSQTETPEPSDSPEPSETPTPTPSESETSTPTPSETATPTVSATPTRTATPTPTATATPTLTASPSPSPTPTASPSATPAPVVTVSVSGTVFVAGTKTPIAGATVLIEAGGTSVGPVNADTFGRYVLQGVPVGDAVIQGIAPGFSTDERPVRLTAGQAAGGEDLFLVSKAPADPTGSIAGAVVLTSDREDGPLFSGELSLVQDGQAVQTAEVADGAFVFEGVKVTGDLRVVVTEAPEGYAQMGEDGYVYNFDGTSVDHLTIRLAPVVPDDSAPAGPDLTWLWLLLGAGVVAGGVAGGVMLARRRRAG